MKNLRKSYQIARIHVLVWLCQRSGYLAWKLGLVSIMGATIISGPNKGWPLGAVIALDKIRAS